MGLGFRVQPEQIPYVAFRSARIFDENITI